MSNASINALSDDLICLILGFMRADDMACMRIACARLVSKTSLSTAITSQLKSAYCIPSLHLSPFKVFSIFEGRHLTPDVLYNFEMSAITRCLEQLSFSSAIGVNKGLWLN
jgi:hypothetical protein